MMMVEDNKELHAELQEKIEEYNIAFNELDDILTMIEDYQGKAMKKKKEMDRILEEIEHLAQSVLTPRKEVR